MGTKVELEKIFSGRISYYLKLNKNNSSAVIAKVYYEK